MLNYKNRKLSDRAALDSTRSKLIDTYNEQFKIYLNESANDSIKINKQIGDGLEAYNEKFIGQGTYQPYNLVAKTSSGELIGGLLSETRTLNKSNIGQVCYLKAIWTNEKYEAQGLGIVLMQKLIHDMKIQHCKSIQIEVFSVAEYSKDFFEYIGFALDGIIPFPGDNSNFKAYEMSLNLDTIDISKIVLENLNHLLIWCSIESYTNSFDNLVHYKNISTIWKQCKSYIENKVGVIQENKFTIFATLKSGKIVVGAICQIAKISNMSYCSVKDLWIDEQYRGNKLG